MAVNNAFGISESEWNQLMYDCSEAEEQFSLDELEAYAAEHQYERLADLTRSTGVCYTMSTINEGDEQHG